VYACNYQFSISGDTGTDTAGSWSTPTKVLEDGVDGSDGLSTYYYPVYRRLSGAPSTPTGGSYNFGTNTGTPPTGWSNTVPASDGNPIYISTALASVQGATGTDSTLTWSAPTVLAQDGTNGVPGANNAVVSLYRKSTSGTTSPASFTGTATYTFSTGAVTGLSFNSWSVTPPSLSLGEYLWVRQAVASSSTPTDTILIEEWSTAVVASYAGENGINGLNSRALFLYRKNTSTTAPTSFTGTATYDFSTDALTGLTLNSWTRTAPSLGKGEYLWVRQAVASSNTNTDTIPIAEWSASAIVGIGGQDGSDGIAGIRGTAALTASYNNTVYNVSVTALSSAQVAALWNGAASATYANEVEGDTLIVTNTSTDANGGTHIYEYTGTAWTASGTFTINGNQVINGTLAAEAIGTGSLVSTASVGGQPAFSIDMDGGAVFRGLEIRDSSNNIILASGGTIDYSAIGGTKPPSDADNTASNTAAGIAGQGAFATLNQISAANISTYMANASIDTLHIGANKVVLPVSSYTSGVEVRNATAGVEENYGGLTALTEGYPATFICSFVASIGTELGSGVCNFYLRDGSGGLVWNSGDMEFLQDVPQQITVMRALPATGSSETLNLHFKTDKTRVIRVRAFSLQWLVTKR
jgi:hypothetical protein